MTFEEAIDAGSATADQAYAIFDALPPVTADQLFGTWKGEEFPSGHRMDGALAGSGWFGKRFADIETVDPLLFHTAERDGFFVAEPVGVARALAGGVTDLSTVRADVETTAPGARLRPVEYRGVVSVAMVYDQLPIIDNFRRVDADTLLGAMDRRGDDGTYFFLLRRFGD